MTDFTPLLLMVALLLACAWMGYRAERQADAARRREVPPCQAAACLSAMAASARKLQAEADRLVLVARRRPPEPLPGMQAKPKRAKARN